MTSIRSHYIPQLLLEGFSRSRKGKKYSQVTCYPIKNPAASFSTSVRNAAAQRNYYSVLRSDGTVDNQIEDILSNRIETPVASVIRKIRCGDLKYINGQNRMQLSKFLYTQIIRSPQTRTKFEVFSSQPPYHRIMTYQPNPSRQDFIAQVHAEATRMTAESSDENDGILLTLNAMTWKILRRDSNNKKDEVGLLLADNPIILTRQKGICKPSGEILFPISVDTLIWIRWSQPESNIAQLNDELIMTVNKYSAQQATERVYYASQQAWVEDLLEGCV